MRLRILIWCVATVCAAPLAAQRRALSPPAVAPADVTLGADVIAGLDGTEPVLTGRGFSDAYSVDLRAGDPVEVSLSSDQFDTYVLVRDPSGVEIATDDDGGLGTNARLLLSPAATGRYTIVATSFGPGITGGYTLRVAPYVAKPISTQAITLGQAVSGRLDADDGMIADRGAADSFVFDLDVGDAIEALAGSIDVDTYLILVGPSGERVAEDDDGAMSGTNSRLRHSALQAGRYRLYVTAFGSEATGAYTLLVGRGFDSTTTSTPLEPGTPVHSILEAGDEIGDAGFAQERYRVDLEVGQELIVTMRSSAFDSYLSLLDTAGFPVVSDDDSGGDFDARVVHVSLVAGTYTLVATSYDGGTGAYVIDAHVRAPAGVSRTHLSVGGSASGTLAEGDARRLLGAGYVDVYTFDGQAGDSVDIDIGDALADVWITGPTGELLPVQSAGTSASLLGVGLPFSGEYTVGIASYQSGSASYDLSIRAASQRAVAVQPIELGRAVEGTLADGDDTALRGSFADVYALAITEPTTVRIRMVAMEQSALDPYLELRSEDDLIIAFNDDAEGYDSMLLELLQPGTYHVVAGQFRDGEGAYGLFVEAAELPALVVEPISFGDHIIGRIDATDASSRGRSTPSDFYRIELASGTAVTVHMTSAELDAVLVLLDETGTVVAENDDAGLTPNSLDARVSFTPLLAGTYTLVASGYDAREGSYDLYVTEGTITDVPRDDL